ncbi:MAG: phosphate-starvation-inducible PsiE family protein [Lachnospiraceae bacterium]
MQKLPTRKKLNDLIINIARYTEIFMSCIITCVIIIMIFNLIIHLPETLSTTIENDAFNQFLSSALGLVVGIEFVKMLCNYTSETVIEVLMMATARQMVVEHLSPINTLIGTIAIAVLFAIRKFLIVPDAKKGKKRKAEDAQNTVPEKPVLTVTKTENQ